jgi:hypothetical protein
VNVVLPPEVKFPIKLPTVFLPGVKHACNVFKIRRIVYIANGGKLRFTSGGEFEHKKSTVFPPGHNLLM